MVGALKVSGKPMKAAGSISGQRRRYLWFGVCLAVFAVLFAGFWLPHEERFFHYATRSHGENWDFRVYYAAGHNWALGLDPYASQYEAPTVRSAAKPIRFPHQHTIRFIYPPTLLPAYRWLAHIPYRKARVYWRDLNFILLAAAGIVAVVLERSRRLEVSAALLLAGMVSFPLLYHVRQGNIDMIVAGLATCGFLLYGRLRSWPTAFLLALAIAAKLTPLLILAALVIYYRDLRILLKTAALLAVMVAVSLLFVPLRYYREAARVLFVRSQSMPGAVNQSAMRFLHTVPWAPRYLSLIAFACLFVGLYRLGRRADASTKALRRSGEAPDIRMFALTVLVMLLFTPLAWVWTYVWVIVPMAMLLVGRQRLHGTTGRLILLSAVALMSAPIARHGAVLDSLTMIGGAIALVALVLCCLGVLDSEPRPA